MKFTALRKNLNQALKIASPAISNQADLQILSNFLITTKQNKIDISATDLEIGVTINLRGKVEEKGQLTVPAQIFSEFVSNSNQERITVKSKEDNLTISDGNSRAKIKGQPADEFPSIPDIQEEKTETLKISGEELLTGLNRVMIAPTQDDSRPVLSGVLFQAEKNLLKLVGTDSYRLAEQKINLEEKVDKFEVIVPLKACREVTRILEKEPASNIEVIISENQIGFQTENKTLVSRLIEGDYPNYEQIIPDGFKIEAQLDREEFLNAAKTAWLFSRDQANNVKLNMDEENLTLKATSPQVGESKTKLKVKDHKGEEIEISFNVKFISEVLNVISSQKVVVKFNQANQPGLIKSTENATNFIYIIMPLKTDESQ